MSETTPDIDKYENADWWTVFRATQLCRELKQERDEARRELDLVSDKLCKSESAYLKNEEIIDGLKNEIEHTETFFREKLSRAADDVNEAKRERDESRMERDEARNIARMAYTRLIGLGVSSHTPIQFMRDAIKAWDKEQKEEA